MNLCFPRLSTSFSKHDPNKNLSFFYLLQKETFFYIEISGICLSLSIILLAVSSLSSQRTLRALLAWMLLNWQHMVLFYFP